jgi:Icc protein
LNGNAPIITCLLRRACNTGHRAGEPYNSGLRLVWLTDIHLNFVPNPRRWALFEEINEARPDAVLIGGDIAEAPTLWPSLNAIAEAIPVPIYFVLGNHDFYRGSIAAVREQIAAKCASSPRLHWMTQAGVVQLTTNTALIGHDSWADARFGDFFRSQVMLNDHLLIEELRGLPKPTLYARLNALGDEAAAFLEDHARRALAHHKEVFVLTHVPPFRESCWHEGRTSGDDWLPHFSCKAVGERLAAVMREHSDAKMTVLCGHTHGSGEAQILENLTVLTGGAEYGYPGNQRVFEIT